MELAFPIFVRASHDSGANGAAPATFAPQKSLVQLVIEANGELGLVPQRQQLSGKEFRRQQRRYQRARWADEMGQALSSDEGHSSSEDSAHDREEHDADNNGGAGAEKGRAGGRAAELTPVAGWLPSLTGWTPPAALAAAWATGRDLAAQYADAHGVSCTAQPLLGSTTTAALVPLLSLKQAQLPAVVRVALERELAKGAQPRINAAMAARAQELTALLLAAGAGGGEGEDDADEEGNELDGAADAVAGPLFPSTKAAAFGKVVLRGLQPFALPAMLSGHHAVLCGPYGCGKRTAALLATGTNVLALEVQSQLQHSTPSSSPPSPPASAGKEATGTGVVKEEAPDTQQEEVTGAPYGDEQQPRAVILVSAYADVVRTARWLSDVFGPEAFAPVTLSRSRRGSEGAGVHLEPVVLPEDTWYGAPADPAAPTDWAPSKPVGPTATPTADESIFAATAEPSDPTAPPPPLPPTADSAGGAEELLRLVQQGGANTTATDPSREEDSRNGSSHRRRRTSPEEAPKRGRTEDGRGETSDDSSDSDDSYRRGRRSHHHHHRGHRSHRDDRDRHRRHHHSSHRRHSSRERSRRHVEGSSSATTTSYRPRRRAGSSDYDNDDDRERGRHGQRRHHRHREERKSDRRGGARSSSSSSARSSSSRSPSSSRFSEKRHRREDKYSSRSRRHGRREETEADGATTVAAAAPAATPAGSAPVHAGDGASEVDSRFGFSASALMETIKASSSTAAASHGAQHRQPDEPRAPQPPAQCPLWEEAPPPAALRFLRMRVPVLITTAHALQESIQSQSLGMTEDGSAPPAWNPMSMAAAVSALPLERVRAFTVIEAERVVALPPLKETLSRTHWMALSNAVDVECQYLFTADRLGSEVLEFVSTTLLPDVNYVDDATAAQLASEEPRHDVGRRQFLFAWEQCDETIRSFLHVQVATAATERIPLDDGMRPPRGTPDANGSAEDEEARRRARGRAWQQEADRARTAHVVTLIRQHFASCEEANAQAASVQGGWEGNVVDTDGSRGHHLHGNEEGGDGSTASSPSQPQRHYSGPASIRSHRGSVELAVRAATMAFVITSTRREQQLLMEELPQRLNSVPPLASGTEGLDNGVKSFVVVSSVALSSSPWGAQQQRGRPPRRNLQAEAATLLPFPSARMVYVLTETQLHDLRELRALRQRQRLVSELLAPQRRGERGQHGRPGGAAAEDGRGDGNTERGRLIDVLASTLVVNYALPWAITRGPAAGDAAALPSAAVPSRSPLQRIRACLDERARAVLGSTARLVTLQQSALSRPTGGAADRAVAGKAPCVVLLSDSEKISRDTGLWSALTEGERLA